jgi:carbon-monoxide dehydrogenase medium subunit
MKPAPFKYTSPPTITAALDLLAEHPYDAKLLAGGQSLIPTMNFRLTQPAMLIDLNQLNDLDYIRARDDNAVQIGSMTRQRTLERSQLVGTMLPLVSETLPFIAHSQIRNRGTIGGSLAHADPAAELPALLVALQGRLRLRNRTAERWVPAETFFKGIFTTDLELDEIIVEVEIPSVSRGQGWSFIEFSRRRGDYAIMGVATLMSIDDLGLCRNVRLVYLNSGEVPLVASMAARILEGEKPSPALFDDMARAAAEEEISPTATIHASVPYMRYLAHSLTRRSLEIALKRAMDSMKE